MHEACRAWRVRLRHCANPGTAGFGRCCYLHVVAEEKLLWVGGEVDLLTEPCRDVVAAQVMSQDCEWDDERQGAAAAVIDQPEKLCLARD